MITEPHTALNLEDEYNVEHSIVFVQEKVVVEFDGFLEAAPGYRAIRNTIQRVARGGGAKWARGKRPCAM